VVGHFQFVAGASSSQADNSRAELADLYNVIAGMKAEREEDRREVKDFIAAVMPLASSFTETAAQIGLGLTDLKGRIELLENTLDGRYDDKTESRRNQDGTETEVAEAPAD
jgi:hypothetical protein